jgi:predicted ArsR family transcriptional regulator
MISQELLTRKGSIVTLLTMKDSTTLTTAEAADVMDVSESTARIRLDSLESEGLVEADADLRDGSAVKVYAVTTKGHDVASGLEDIVTDNESQSE